MLVDSHCHLDFKDFDADRDDVLARAKAAGVDLMVTISTKITEAKKIIKLAETSDALVCSVGIHPHEAGREPETDAAQLVALAKHEKVVGIGETGLDYFYEHSPRDAQQRNFRAHIEACRESRLPLIVHARDADEDTADILENEMEKGDYPGLIHCFTAGPELAQRALDIGFYISVSGIATFKNAAELRETIKMIPLDRLLVETDAPFLAPVPHRGKRNEPSFVADTAAMLADLKGVTTKELARVTSDNFFSLFKKAKRPVDA
ncbi:MAG TPA: LuxR family transcriptional regulator [Rhodobiaceae bacterium]|nr:LuxR family transcriptional regulator [Rhodobiaceae bacterium]|tara:strand:- start:1360 stop:2148 length:789 start_codon:yes stop_codon:yes gene_type:complete